MSDETNAITAVCSTHKPNRVTATNKNISRFKLVPVVWNVYFLLAKKLKINAVEVEMTLAPMTGRPSDLSVKRIPKSISVLAPPTTINLAFSSLFLMVGFFTCVVFLYKVKRTVFSFIKDTANILANNANRKQLHAS